MNAGALAAAPLAVSMGDPAGVGLEIAVRTWTGQRAPPFFVIADVDAVRRAGDAPVAPINSPAEANAAFARGLPVLHEALATREQPGAPTPANAPAVVRSIERAVAYVRSGEARAIVTLPIAKATLYAAGFRHPGHTEFVAELTADMPFAGERGPVMMLASPELRVALATIHAPLADVPSLLSQERIARTARVVLQALARDFGIERPRLALAALNPHAGESGALGREELDVINPVAAALRAEGHDVSDARSADTLFHAEARAGYDAVVAMYHDQGLVPIKTLDFWGAMNITLGLPIVRTSPDHGAAFDIAGRGLANPASFAAALAVAADIAARRAS